MGLHLSELCIIGVNSTPCFLSSYAPHSADFQVELLLISTPRILGYILFPVVLSDPVRFMVEVTRRFRNAVVKDVDFQRLATDTLPAIVAQWKVIPLKRIYLSVTL